MASYLPFAGKHSIQEAAVRVQFQARLPPDLVELMRAGVLETHEEDFPRSCEVHAGEVKINVGDLPGAPSIEVARLVGFELSKPRADGASARVLRLSGDVLLTSFFEYTKWDDVASHSASYVRSAIARIPLSDVPVQSFGLRYVDRFAFDGPMEQACAGLLFEPKSEYLAGHCFGAGPLWHSNVGWFESRNEQERVLNQLNVVSTTVDDVPTVTIEHDAAWQLRTPRQSLESLFQPGEGMRTPLEEALTDLHEGNKSMIRAVLLPDMLEKIGLAT